MKLKLDENVDLRLANPLIAAGHDTTTVQGEKLSGASDATLLMACRREERALVSLGLDFANVLLHPPAGAPGLVVLRIQDQRFATMRLLVDTLIEALRHETPTGQALDRGAWPLTGS